jgi:lysophospholipase L1-like esterase
MPDAGYTRYVAIGDSRTEGLWDGGDSFVLGVGLTGFADVLAVMIDSLYPGLKYANLAIRGKRVRDVLRDQLPQALAMQPDLTTVCAGMNDVTRPERSFSQALADLEHRYAVLAESGAAVVTTTFPDVARLVPVGRLLASRVARINAVIRAAAERYGFGLVAAEALNLPGSNHDWARMHGNETCTSFRTRAYAQLRWTQTILVPWIWRHLRGRSSGDGRQPKRPQLETLTIRCGAPRQT